MSTLLQINKLTKAYGAHTLFQDATLNIGTNQKIGVVGRNGAGKSTLFKIITGEETADLGEIIIHKQTRIGYLTQHDPFDKSEKVIDFLMTASGKEEWECCKLAAQFQIVGDKLTSQIGALAGGYQMRVKLVNLLLSEPNLLLLDEPTNYLDLSTQLLFEEFLQGFKGTFLLISHDREFMKKTCTMTAEVEHGKITCYPRPLEEYLVYKGQRREQIVKANTKIEQKKQHLQSFVDRFGSKASKASQAQSKLKQIARLNGTKVDHELSTVKIRIPEIKQHKGIALKIKDLAIGYPDKVVAQNINLDIERGEHIAIVGDNGQGKTTLLKTIAGELQKLKGDFSWGHKIKIGYFAQHVPALMPESLTIKTYLEKAAPLNVTEQEIMAMAGSFLFSEETHKKKIKVLSGGEKARLCLAGLLLQENHVLLFDEPTNHLDFETTEALANALKTTSATVIFVSHNRTFVGLLANGIIQVQDGMVSRYYHNYEEYVYHVKSKLLSEITTAPSSSETTSDKQNFKQQQKDLRKQIRQIESQIAKLESEKHELLEWFELNHSKYSEDKNRRLKEIHDLLEVKESEWFKIQTKLDNLKGN